MSEIIYHDVEQNSEDWMEMRAGLITSSKIAVVMAHYPKAFGEPAKTYARHIALERFRGEKIEVNSFKSRAMDLGHDLEPLARQLYEKENFVTVNNGGFFEDGKIGDSPDGLVGSDGVVEIKSVDPEAHWSVLEKGSYSTSYKWQIQNHLRMTERDWCDFVSFCPKFTHDKKLLVVRVYPDEEMQRQMTIRLAQFEELVKENIKLLTK